MHTKRAYPPNPGFRSLVAVHDFILECLALVVDISISGHRVARELGSDAAGVPWTLC